MSRKSWDIHQCPLAMRCRARWEQLEPVLGDPAIRYCSTCERSVFLCRNDADLSRHSALGRCVALEVVNVGVAHIGQSLPGLDPGISGDPDEALAEDEHPAPPSTSP